jgi:hypothetical protein
LAAPYVASQLVQQSRSDVEPVAIVRQKTDAYGGTFIQQYKMLEPNTKLYTTPPAPVLPHCEHDFKMSPSYGGYLCAVCGKPERRK